MIYRPSRFGVSFLLLVDSEPGRASLIDWDAVRRAWEKAKARA
jgi:hypothetical protein